MKIVRRQQCRSGVLCDDSEREGEAVGYISCHLSCVNCRPEQNTARRVNTSIRRPRTKCVRDAATGANTECEKRCSEGHASSGDCRRRSRQHKDRDKRCETKSDGVVDALGCLPSKCSVAGHTNVVVAREGGESKIK